MSYEIELYKKQIEELKKTLELERAQRANMLKEIKSTVDDFYEFWVK